MKRRPVILVALVAIFSAVAIRVYWADSGDESETAVFRPVTASSALESEQDDDRGDDPHLLEPPATQAVEYRRWAILPIGTIAGSGLPDLVMAELSKIGGFEFVERERLAAITEEQRLAASLGADAPQRVSLGKLLKADALILLAKQRIGKAEYLKMTVSDTAMGVRIADVRMPISQQQITTSVKTLSTTIDRARRRFANGVKLVVGIPPFLSRDLTHQNDVFREGLAALTENALFTTPGVAIVEIDEARAVRGELDIAGNQSVHRAMPLFVSGEYETSLNKDAQLQLALKINISDGSKTVGHFDEPAKLQSQAVVLLTDTLPTVILEAAAQGYQPLPRSTQIKLLYERADEFSALGSWEKAIRLRESVLVLNPNRSSQRKRIVSETLQWLKEEYTPVFMRWNEVRWSRAGGEISPRDPAVLDAKLKEDMESFWDRSLPEWLRAFDHLEFLLRNRQIAWSEVNPLLDGLASMDFASIRPYASRIGDQRQVRSRLQRFVAELGPELEHLAAQSQLDLDRRQWRDVIWKCVFGFPASREDLEPVEKLIEQFPDDPDVLPPYPLLKTFEKMAFSFREDPALAPKVGGDFDAILKLIEQSKKQPLRLLATVARVWMTDNIEEHRRSREEVRSQLDGSYKAIQELVAQHTLAYQYVSDLEFATGVCCQVRLSDTFRFRTTSFPQTTTRPPAQPGLERRGISLTEPPRAGPVTFDRLPIAVANGKDAPIPISTWTENQRYASPAFDLFLLPCGVGPDGKGVDVAWDRHAVFLHRKPALLEPIMVQPDEADRAVVFDGENIFLGTRLNGLFVLDRSGKTIAHLTPENGLPPADVGLVGIAISTGKVLLAGSFGEQRRGWMAIVQRQEGASGFSVNVFHKATHPPDPRHLQKRDFSALRAAAQDPEFVFCPLWAALAPPGAKTPSGAVWIARGHSNDFGIGDEEMLFVDLQTLKVSVQNIHHGSPPVRFITDDEFVESDGYLNLRRLLGKFEDGRNRHLFLASPGGESNATILEFQGKWFVPGGNWYRVDPKSLLVEHIGPGIHQEGYTATGLRYLTSSVCGMMGYSDLNFYPVSVDPKNQLAFHAIPNNWNPPNFDARFQNAQQAVGTIRTAGDGREFWTSGRAQLSVGYREGNRNFSVARSEPDRNFEIWLRRLHLAFERPEEQRRLELSSEQISRLSAALKQAESTKSEDDGVAALYAKYGKAASAAEKATYRDALFARIFQIGENLSRRPAELDQALHQILSSNQFRAITYDPPE